jgi:acetyl-CoA/propionyl-CoA carboxylase biotin carboxyl carrier protein
MTLTRILIANRGEIAVRVVRACRDEGLTSIAVYSDEDRDAVHVRLADEAYSLAGAGAAETYLDIDALLGVAQAACADAVHPGYGFLAESATFARRVIAAGLVWIGPPPEAIEALGDKVQARAIARAAGAALLPGTDQPIADAAAVHAFAAHHGFPLVIKAAHGGGGRGMRVVRASDEIADAFDAATRESTAAFGRGECFVERYLDAPRHIETQCLADAYGRVAVLATRDCSLQRRHQKLIEEAPAPFLPSDVEDQLIETSRAVLRHVGYVGAATVEFLVSAAPPDDAGSPPGREAALGRADSGMTGTAGPTGGAVSAKRPITVAFLEVNTRLQVEHPVTEEVTGVDLVREQFRLAAGGALTTDGVPAQGHAIEFRINGEDPAAGFVPSPGPLTHLRLPGGPGVRVDFGYEVGDRLTGSFDSLLGKVIVKGRDRAEALARARRALAEMDVRGVATVLDVHRALLEHPAFTADGADCFTVHTRFLEAEAATLLPRPPAAPQPGETRGRPGEAGWGSASAAEDAAAPSGRVVVEVGGKRFEVLLPAGLMRAATPTSVRRAPRRSIGAAPADGTVAAPMQGTIVRLAVAEGQVVEAGQVIVVLEAMKMEQPLTAPKAGTVRGLSVQVGDKVAAGSALCVLE